MLTLEHEQNGLAMHTEHVRRMHLDFKAAHSFATLLCFQAWMMGADAVTTGNAGHVGLFATVKSIEA